MEFVLACIYLLVTGAVIYSMAVLYLQGVKNFSNKMYLACHGCVTIWCSSQILNILSDSSGSLLFSYMYGNLGICFAGAFWVLFSASYGNNSFRYSRLYFIPFILSAIHYGLIASNGLHHMYYKTFELGNVTHGLFFYTNVAETYLFIILGAFLLLINSKRCKSENDPTAFASTGRILIILAVIIPVVFSLVFILGLIKTTFDITPLGFAISVILVRAATTRYQFFDMKKELDIATEKLVIAKERNRIAQEVHDTTGHTLTMLQSYMKLVEVSINENDSKSAYEYVAEARELTSKGIKELRESINQLRQEEEYELLTQGILQLAHQVKEIPCEVTIQGEDSEKYSYLSKVVYDTVRESITNTLKYANANKIDIVIRFKKQTIDLMIADDGIGCDMINDNNGLRGIRERIEKSGGTVRFTSSANEGFMTRVSLPI